MTVEGNVLSDASHVCITASSQIIILGTFTNETEDFKIG